MRREMDAQIAERIMGDTVYHGEIQVGERFWVEENDGSFTADYSIIYAYSPRIFVGELVHPRSGCGGIRTNLPADIPLTDACPPYSTDLNACATAEARIISMGLGARYVDALRDVVGPLIPAHGLSLITASAEARCRAMLATLEGK